VLVPLLEVEGAWHILFTRRTPSLPEHSGQVAFPGGRSDPEDLGPDQTALREAEEEIGLRREHVELLGRLKPLRTITNYCVTPVVGAIPWPYPLRLAEVEVSRVFTIPLDWLAEPGHHTILDRELPPPYSPVPVIYFDPYDNELLWGVSAQITVDLLRALGLLEPDS
jgi:8-oxo-dGTP pyrophosphatase MutT (NUDIX family)